MGSCNILEVWRVAPLCLMLSIWREHNAMNFEDRETWWSAKESFVLLCPYAPYNEWFTYKKKKQFICWDVVLC